MEEGRGEAFVNDLEVPSFELVPLLGELKDAIRGTGFENVLMSGSGTSFFALGIPADLDWARFEDDMKERFDARVFRASFINRDEDKWYFE
mmetsp:Transcript_14245/g.38113  ORF Transcript_14245/g.38113 Transcript_14245/m.38113 type:complete len:91 (+) Transcript_14245:2-274(+)